MLFDAVLLESPDAFATEDSTLQHIRTRTHQCRCECDTHVFGLPPVLHNLQCDMGDERHLAPSLMELHVGLDVCERAGTQDSLGESSESG